MSDGRLRLKYCEKPINTGFWRDFGGEIGVGNRDFQPGNAFG